MSLFLLLFGGKKIGCSCKNATELLDLCFRYDIAYKNFDVDEEGNLSFCCSLSSIRRSTP